MERGAVAWVNSVLGGTRVSARTQSFALLERADMTRPKRLRPFLLMLAAALVVGACYPLDYMPGTPRPTWCDPTDTAVNDGHTTSFYAFYTTPKAPLSQTDCQAVVGYLNQAAAYAAQFPTVASVEAAGWIQATVWTPGQGIHFVDPTRLAGPFDPTRPNWLLYNGTSDSANLVGMMFLVESGVSPPAGFPGANDQWHNHDKLCYDADAIPFIIGEHFSDSFCAAVGGVNTDYSGQWMVHAWLPVYAGWQATDIFNKSHANIS